MREINKIKQLMLKIEEKFPKNAKSVKKSCKYHEIFIVLCVGDDKNRPKINRKNTKIAEGLVRQNR